MNLHEDQLAKLRAFGYTEVEARFLYLAVPFCSPAGERA